MTKTSYCNGTIVLELDALPRSSTTGVSVMTTTERHGTASTPTAFLQVGRPAASYNILIVPHHGQEHSPRFASWFGKLRKIAGLKDGWDSYTAPKPAPAAIAAAGLYLSTLDLLAWEPARVEPSAMGGVGVTHRQGSRKVYIEFYNNGTVHALFSDRSDHGPKMETKPVVADVPSFYQFIRQAREYLND